MLRTLPTLVGRISSRRCVGRVRYHIQVAGSRCHIQCVSRVRLPPSLEDVAKWYSNTFVIAGSNPARRVVGSIMVNALDF